MINLKATIGKSNTYMHWEKIPLQKQMLYKKDGRYEKVDLVKEQLKVLKRQGVPYRFVRTRGLDGSETSIEKQVQSKVCDFKDCNNEATNILDCDNVEVYFSIYMCSQHYQYFQSDESLGKELNFKEIEKHARAS